MENQEIDLDTVIYGYINTINANYARMNANFKIPNILITWNHKSNEIKNIFNKAGLDINDSIVGSIILKTAEKILVKALGILADFCKKASNKILPEGIIKDSYIKMVYSKSKKKLEEYIELDNSIKSIDIKNEIKDYIYLYCLYLANDEYEEEDIIEFTKIIDEELKALEISNNEELIESIYSLLRGNENGIKLSKKQ